MPTRTNEEAIDWRNALVFRLRISRNARELTYTEAGTASGLGTIPQKLEWTVLDGGKGAISHVRLDQLLPMAEAYNVLPEDLLEGWPAWKSGFRPPVHLGCIPSPELEVCDTLTRSNLRFLRKRAGLGLRPTAEGAVGKRSWSAALNRIENGRAPHLHLARIWQLSEFFDVKISDLLLTDLHNED